MLGEALGVSQEEADRRIREYLIPRWESHLRRVPLFAGVRECVSGLRELGLKLAVSSDFPVDHKLKLLGLNDLFDCQLWTETSGYLKPNPEPFEELSECIGEAPADILYVGNSYAYDIVGARNAGMHAAHLSRRAVHDSVADLTFYRFETLLKWVQEQLRNG